MKLFFIKFLFVVFFLTTTFSCMDENEVSKDFEGEPIEKKEGYLPLAPDMYWYYENHTAELNTSLNVWEYEDSVNFPDSEVFISGINKLKFNPGTDTSVNRLNYEFAAISDNGFFGNLTGNLQKVYKNINTGEYFKSEFITISVPGVDSTEMDKKLVIRLKDYPFLDDDANVGDVLYIKRDSVVNESDIQGGGKSVVNYEYTIKVAGKYNKIPIRYANTVGEDTHLNSFRDIMHIREEMKIISVISTGAEVTTEVDAKIVVTPDNDQSFFKATIFTAHSVLGKGGRDIFLSPLKLIPLPLLSSPDGRTKTYSRNSIFTYAPEITAKICAASADFSDVQTSKGNTLEIISNQIPFVRETFYAWNVGKIKTITSVRQIDGELKVQEFDSASDPLEILTLDNDGCLDDVNKMKFQLVSQTEINESKFRIPLLFGENISIVSNLLKYNVQ